MSGLEPVVSKVKRHNEPTKAELVLLKACEKAAEERRPFTITSGYDNTIGAFNEYSIWYATL